MTALIALAGVVLDLGMESEQYVIRSHCRHGQERLEGGTDHPITMKR